MNVLLVVSVPKIADVAWVRRAVRFFRGAAESPIALKPVFRLQPNRPFSMRPYTVARDALRIRPSPKRKPFAMKLLIALTTLLLSLLAALPAAEACTIIAAGRLATTDGSVLVSQTDTGQDSRIYVAHGREWPEGEMAPVYFGIQDATNALEDDGEVLGHIPQVRRTYTYFHTAYSHINEHQLAIAESTTDQRDELKVTKDTGEQIMTIEQAMIFALQRHRKAREAAAFIGELMTTYGFLPSSGDGSEALVIGDPEEAWVFEVFGVGPGWTRASGRPGAIWAAQRVPDDAAVMIPNYSIIKQIDPSDAERFMVSDNYLQEAVDRGFYDPASGRPFTWQEAYATLPGEWATGRFWLFHTEYAPTLRDWPDRTLDGNVYKTLNQYFQVVEPLSIYPFSIRPERKLSVPDIMAFQRSVFEDTIYDITAQPQWLVPGRDEAGRLDGSYVKSPLATPFPGSDLRELLQLTHRRPVARHRGHSGMIAQLRSWMPDPVGGVYWIFVDNPYVGPYVPMYAGNLSVHESYRIYDPEQYDERSARWAFDFVDNLARLKFQAAIEDIRAVREPFEQRMLEQQEEIEQEALARYAESPQAAREFLTGYSNGLMQQATELYVGLRNQLIVNYTNNRE
jgi:dipeptidase